MIFLAPEAWPFAAALAIMVALSVLEGAGLLISHSPSHFLDGLLPEMPDGVDGPLGWLHLGKVPVLVLLILFLAGFALSGYVIQSAVQALTGHLLASWIAAIPAALAGFSTVSGIGALLAKVMPRDETTAISEQALLGRAGVIVRGEARNDYAAEAKVRDLQGRAHYVMVESDIEGETFTEGNNVLLVRKVGARYRCIRNPHPELL
jgi:hypothetical protein